MESNSSFTNINSAFLSSNTENITNSANYIIGLAGNPNVGKSTIFNSLTGMHQHTGNWPGKTVSNASRNIYF